MTMTTSESIAWLRSELHNTDEPYHRWLRRNWDYLDRVVLRAGDVRRRHRHVPYDDQVVRYLAAHTLGWTGPRMVSGQAVEALKRTVDLGIVEELEGLAESLGLVAPGDEDPQGGRTPEEWLAAPRVFRLAVRYGERDLVSRALSNLLEHRAEGATEGWVEDWIDLLDELEFEVEDAIGDANEAYHWYGGMGDPLYALASHPGPHSFGTYRWALSNLESSLKSHTEYVEELAARVKELTADLALMESGTRPDLFEFITLDELEDELATAEEKAEDAARAIEDADPLLDRLTAFVERGEFGAAY